IKEAAKAELQKGTGTILLVDDEEDNLTGVSMTLEVALGYEVFTASSGAEAIEMFSRNENEINLVILDLVMPEMDGGETFDKLRELSPKVKVLLSSGYSLEGQAAEIMERGCDGFIQKPFDLGTLSEKIHEVLDQD
ncbi:MAG: response regulator, partial [bacterium]